MVYTLIDEVAWEGYALVYQFSVLKRIVYLSVGHGTGVEPHVYEVALSLHLLSCRAYKEYIVHVRPVQVYLVIVLLGHVAGYEALLLQRVA